MNADFWRIARRDKKGLLNELSKEIKEINRIGKTRDLFEKIGDIKGILLARMGMIKDRNGKAVTEAEEIKKRCKEYTELYKKSLNDPDNHDSVVTHLESDILECEVKQALASITINKVSGGTEFQLSYLKS